MDFKKKLIFFPDSREYRQLSFLPFCLSVPYCILESRHNFHSFYIVLRFKSRRNSTSFQSPSAIVAAYRLVVLVSNRLPQSSQLIALWFCVPSQFHWLSIALRNRCSLSPCGSVSRRNSIGFRSPSEVVAA